MPTERDVADWMIQELSRVDELYQEDAVAEIEHRFGLEFVYENPDGGASISRKVLRVFRELTGDDVVWERSAGLWRKREPSDRPGRQQD